MQNFVPKERCEQLLFRSVTVSEREIYYKVSRSRMYVEGVEINVVTLNRWLSVCALQLSNSQHTSLMSHELTHTHMHTPT